jgi:ribosomal protein S18 acetylase RimI-like enzyme
VSNKISSLVFNRAQVTDAKAVSCLVNGAYRGDDAKVGWTTEASILGGVRTSVEAVAQMIVDPEQYLLTVHSAGELVGCCALSRHSAHEAYVGMVTVKPQLQGQQLGRMILEHAESIAQNDFNANFIRMTVISVRSELIAWYIRRGYVDTGEREPFPMHDRRFGEPLVDHLEFIVMRKVLRSAS